MIRPLSPLPPAPILPRLARLACLIAPLAVLGGCDAVRLGFLHAAGPVAGGERHVFVIVAIVLLFVAGPVLLLTPLIAWHYRLSNKDDAYRPNWDFSWTLEGFIWIPPALIVVGLAFVLWNATHRFDPYRAIASDRPALDVQAVALDWKWLFIYPDAHVATINQLAIPVGRPVRIHLTSGTVMQSMLIPQLAGQIYAMAGMTTQLNIAADRPGNYRGENTQFSGKGFQDQKFRVVALPEAGYAAWLDRIRGGGEPFDRNVYAALFRQSTVPAPRFYRGVPDGLFRRMLARSTAPAQAIAEAQRR